MKKTATNSERNDSKLPLELINIILDYKASMEHHDRYKKVMVELYYQHWLRRPFWLGAIAWWIPF